jgi:hypothetical protein
VSPRHLHLFSALKQNIGDRKYKEDGETERVLTRWLITQEADF